MQKWIFQFAVSSAFCAVWLAHVIVVESKSFERTNMTVKFSLASRKNKTGHIVTTLEMDKSSMELPENWNVDVEHRFAEYNGVKSVYLLGVFTVPPGVPSDYELFPGIGYYKFHSEVAQSFNAASNICFEEGGHLAIINSQAEADLIAKLWSRFTSTPGYNYWSAYLGFHDQLKEGEFITLFGQHINSTGYTKWSVKQPDNYEGDENCGSITREGLLNDVNCKMKLPFACEYELSWNS